jgi:GntR family transcriptional regulator
MEIRLSSLDGVPVYRQIVNQVKYQVAAGRLAPGQELPAIRSLAEKLVINPNTVVRAYAELEREGLIVCRHGSGSYIAETAPKPSRKEASGSIAAKIDSLLADAAHLQMGLDEVLDAVRERHTHLKINQNP